MPTAFSIISLSNVGHIVDGMFNSLSEKKAGIDNVPASSIVWSDEARRTGANAVIDFLCSISDKSFMIRTHAYGNIDSWNESHYKLVGSSFTGENFHFPFLYDSSSVWYDETSGKHELRII